LPPIQWRWRTRNSSSNVAANLQSRSRTVNSISIRASLLRLPGSLLFSLAEFGAGNRIQNKVCDLVPVIFPRRNWNGDAIHNKIPFSVAGQVISSIEKQEIIRFEFCSSTVFGPKFKRLLRKFKKVDPKMISDQSSSLIVCQAEEFPADILSSSSSSSNLIPNKQIQYTQTSLDRLDFW
jgi:hypothetical protein